MNQTFVLMSSDGINTEHFDGCENEKKDPLSSWKSMKKWRTTSKAGT